jgi:hypothetical protein
VTEPVVDRLVDAVAGSAPFSPAAPAPA